MERLQQRSCDKARHQKDKMGIFRALHMQCAEQNINGSGNT